MGSLILHVGLGKTGTSSIQNVLPNTLSKTKKSILHYPYDASCDSSGNGHLLMDAITNKDHTFLSSISRSFCTVFSREHLARELSDSRRFSEVSKFLHRYYLPSDIRVIIYIRNPSSHCFSLWSQKIKNRKTTLNLLDFSYGYDSYSVLLSFLFLSVSYGWNVSIVDYDLCKHNLFNSFLDLLPVPLIYPSTTIPLVNSSPDYYTLTSIRLSSLLYKYFRIHLSHNNFILRLVASFFPSLSASDCCKRINTQFSIYHLIKSVT